MSWIVETWAWMITGAVIVTVPAHFLLGTGADVNSWLSMFGSLAGGYAYGLWIGRHEPR